MVASDSSLAGSTTRQLRWVAFWSLVGLLPAVSCPNELVPVPAPAQDKAPVITVSNLAPGANGEIEQPVVSSSSVVNASLGMQLMISGNASNSAGGVQSFSIVVSQSGQTLFAAKTTGSADASKNVPTILRILGSDGAGGAGNKPMLVRMTSQAVLTATATNFNGMTTSITVTYVPQPITAAFTAEQDLEPGDEGMFFLRWKTDYYTDGWSVSISPWTDPTPPVLAGMTRVNPDKTTCYTLVARTPFSMATRSVTVTRGSTGSSCPAVGPQSFAISLKQVAPASGGPIGWAANFPDPGLPWLCTSHLVAIVNANTMLGTTFPVELIKLNSQYTTADCFANPAAYVVLQPGQSTTSTDIMEIYGSSNPTLSPSTPVGIVACPEVTMGVPSAVYVTVNYTNQ